MTTARTLRIDRFGSTLFAALGLAPLIGCGSSVEPEGTGGSGSGGGDPSSTSSDATGTGTSTSSGVLTNPFPCTSPQPRVVDGVDTGYDACEDGTLRRREAVTCPSLLPRDGEVCNDAVEGSCRSDADCPGTNAYCES